MARYVQIRLLTAIPVVVGLSLIVFLMVNLLPGDAVDLKLAEQGASAERIQELRRELGLNDPLPVQYLRFAGGALHGDLGRSLFSNQLVTTQIAKQVPATLQLTLAAMVVALALGVTLGVIAAVKHNTWVDSASMLVALVGVSMPTFWFGLILIFVFSLRFGWFPASGTDGLRALVLPAITLGFHSSAIIARLTRSSMLEVLRQEYVITARAKGLANRAVILQHALRNALLPVVTVIGLQFGYLLGGAVVIETVFARQGVGQLIVSGILQRDVPLVQGMVFFLSVIFVLCNLLVDVSYAVLDPRIRYQ